MKKPFLVTILAAVAIIVVAVFFFTKKTQNTPQLPPPTQNPTTTTSVYEYYWGNGCPHCENVNNFLSTWSGTNKIEIKHLEVFNNQYNASQMLARAQKCNLPRSEQGAVPLLYTPNGKCVAGDTPIINYFKSLNL